jgi:hypothetical protein
MSTVVDVCGNDIKNTNVSEHFFQSSAALEIRHDAGQMCSCCDMSCPCPSTS